MKTLQEQLVDKGLAEKPVEERIIEHTPREIVREAAYEVAAIAKTIYRPRQKLYNRKERHGRTKILEVKKLMETLDRNSIGYRMIAQMKQHVINGGDEGMTSDAIIKMVQAVEGNEKAKASTMFQFIYGMTQSGVLRRGPGKKPYPYYLVHPNKTVDELYIQFSNYNTERRKKYPHSKPRRRVDQFVESPKQGVQPVPKQEEIKEITVHPEIAKMDVEKLIEKFCAGLSNALGNITININVNFGTN